MIVNSSSTGGNKKTTRVHKKVSINGADEDGIGLRRGPWTLEEDNLLIQYISCHGEGRWNSLAKSAGLNRTGKSCRLRWLNYLKPDIKRGNLTPQEQLIILELHAKWGNRWSRIAQNLPGRTDNEIKNYWRTRVQKQARQLKVDSNSKKFLEAIRLYWVPRLMEKIEQNSGGPVAAQGPVPMSNLASSCPDSDNYSTGSSSLEIPGFHDLTGGKALSSGSEDCYRVGMPTYQVQELETFPECHVGEIDWFGEDIGSTFWNTDDLWQFRRSAEEVGV